MSGSADSHLVAPCTAGKPVELWSSGTRGGTGAPQLASVKRGDTTLLLKISCASIQKCPEKSSNTKVCASTCSDKYRVFLTAPPPLFNKFRFPISFKFQQIFGMV